MLITATCESPLGDLRLVADADTDALVAVLWPDETPGRVRFDIDPRTGTLDILTAAGDQLEEYFSGARTGFDLKLDPRGTEFQRQVWWALADIPYGETSTYAKQAAAVGRPTATRAVGSANGRNPLSIVLPCHRIVGSDGRLTGFAGGIAAKRWLLDHEQAASTNTLFGP